MKKRLIAALVLTALAGWSVPGALAASSSSIAEKSAQQAAASEQDHSCCPGVHSRFVPPLFVKPGPASMPCGEQHPCCAKQGPENPPSLPATTKLAAPGFDGVLTTIADQYRDDATLVGKRLPPEIYSGLTRHEAPFFASEFLPRAKKRNPFRKQAVGRHWFGCLE